MSVAACASTASQVGRWEESPPANDTAMVIDDADLTSCQPMFKEKHIVPKECLQCSSGFNPATALSVEDLTGVMVSCMVHQAHREAATDLPESGC